VPEAIQGRIDEMKTRGILDGMGLQEGKASAGSGSGGDPAQQSALEAEGGKKRKARDVAPSASRELAGVANELTVQIVERLYSQWEDGVGVYG
jgi:hypothetical protein